MNLFLFVLAGVVVICIGLYLMMRRHQRCRAQLIFNTFEGKYVLITGAARGIGRGKLYTCTFVHVLCFFVKTQF